MASMTDVRKQAVTGVVPPETAEAVIRVAWPAVTRAPAVASLARVLMRTLIGAPLAFLMMAPFYFKKVMPFFATRYTLTNQRVMIQYGLKATPGPGVKLADIDDITVKPDGNTDFFRAATVEIISKGQVALTLPGVPEPEAFRHAIRNACMAWVPGKAAAWITFAPAKGEAAK